MRRVKRLAVEPFHRRGPLELYRGDLRDVVPALGRFDAVVTDPPYGIDFLGQGWDAGVPGVEFWKVVLAALKPGGQLLAFGGTRKFHRLFVAIEDAGFELRDCVSWLYGTGFPKSADVSKAIDKKIGVEREVLGFGPSRASNLTDSGYAKRVEPEITRPATDEAAKWEGWGTALKPAWEPIVLARRSLEGTVAANVLRHGTGGINVDACRVKMIEGETTTTGGDIGRWPANVAYDGSDEVLSRIPGGSDRFFYCAKVSRGERGEGNDHPTVKPIALMRYLLRLVTPPGGVVLDPFAGSGSTLLAAREEGVRAVGVELEPRYCEIAARRIGGPRRRVLA